MRFFEQLIKPYTERRKKAETKLDLAKLNEYKNLNLIQSQREHRVSCFFLLTTDQCLKTRLPKS
jgi:hypothetical protein